MDQLVYQTALTLSVIYSAVHPNSCWLRARLPSRPLYIGERLRECLILDRVETMVFAFWNAPLLKPP